MASKRTPERCERHQEGDHRPPEGSRSEVSPEVVHRDRDPQDQHGEPDDAELAQILRAKAQYLAELELETDELAEPLPGREEVIDKQEAEQNRPAGVQPDCRPDGDEDQCECDPTLLEVLERLAEPSFECNGVVRVGKQAGGRVDHVEHDEDKVYTEAEQQQLV